MRDFPTMTDHSGRVEPVPRRLRGYLGSRLVFDTTAASYAWEHPRYPQYHVPLRDVRQGLLVDEGITTASPLGPTARHGLRVDDVGRPGAARVFGRASLDGLAGTVAFDWPALDAWFEEEEQVFVHARNPYTRVDALRSSRHVLVELDGVRLAEASSPVLVFETGLPTRYYLERTAVDFDHLTSSDTVTQCPYKGRTTGCWNARTGATELADAAWSYDFPTRALAPIAGLVAFYNERTDITVDGQLLERPSSPFS